MEHEFLFDGNAHTVKVEKQNDRYRMTVGENSYEVDASPLSEGLFSMVIDGRSILVHTARDEQNRMVCIGGVPYSLAYPSDDYSADGGAGGGGGDGVIATPMPGKIVTVHVKEGDTVKKDQPLIVVESMKMQNDILSDVNGVVKKIHFKAGDQASFGEPLVEIEVAE